MYRKYSNNGEISSMQAYIIIISIMIGTGILGLARMVSEVSKQDAWISILVNGAFISMLMGIIVFIASRFPQYNFFQYTCYLLSKPIGYIVVFAFIAYSIFTTSIIIRFMLEMVITWFLPNTPLYIISFIIIITVVYMIQNGLTTLARFNEVIFFLLIPLFLLIFISLPEARFINLRPVGGTGLKTIIKGGIPSFYAFGGYEVMLIYYHYISNKEKPIIKYSMLSILLVTIFYSVMVVTQIMLFGYQELQRVLYPSINYLRAIDFPLLERMELFFTIFWSFTVLGTAGLQYFASCAMLKSVFTTRTTRFFTYLLAPFIFIVSLIPSSTPEVAKLGDIIGKANIFFGLLLPVLLLIMFFIRGGRQKSEETL